MSTLHAVVMAGGSGTRFWPASRAGRPKQFLPLADGETLIAATIARLRGVCDVEHTWIVTNAAQAAQLPALLPDFPAAQVIVEPEARDTAPCVALATARIAARDPGATIAMMPADHVIAPAAAFHAMLRRGAAIAADGATLVTFGVRPDHPATGYGYVQCGAALSTAAVSAAEPRAFVAARFCEKPDRPTAERFVADGSYLWNSGIFVWSVAAIAAAMQHGDPALGDAYRAMLAALQTSALPTSALAEAFRAAPRTSIDYAVMERAPRVAVVEAAGLRWNDVGSFPALADITPADAGGNHSLLGDGAQQLQLDSRGNIVYAEGPRTVALFGVHDLVVVAVGDAVLVCPKDRAADLKQLIEHARRQGRADLL
ncbi:MAG: mannose-1-phosphate guanylyltransferase [Planctomycetes bacterium]|nr:mannose-1-phosphate guanylyltransferase [Planctomycetota bacterium]